MGGRLLCCSGRPALAWGKLAGGQSASPWESPLHLLGLSWGVLVCDGNGVCGCVDGHAMICYDVLIHCYDML